MSHKYQAVITYCDSKNRRLGKIPDQKIEDYLSEKVKDSAVKPYVFVEEQDIGTSLVNRTYTTSTRCVYKPYPLDQFVSEIRDLALKDVLATMRSKGIILAKIIEE